MIRYFPQYVLHPYSRGTPSILADSDKGIYNGRFVYRCVEQIIFFKANDLIAFSMRLSKSFDSLVENVIRPITLGRKNYLFCGNHETEVNISVICFLLATNKAHGVNLRDYFNDVIVRMPIIKRLLMRNCFYINGIYNIREVH